MSNYSAENSKYRKIIILVLAAVSIGIMTNLALLHYSNAVSLTNTESSATAQAGFSIDTLEKYFSIVSGVAEVGIVILLFKTVKDFAELAKVSRLQTEVRFRPWIGPSGNIAIIGQDSERNQYQYAIPLKNFGEVPSSAVIARSSISVSLPTREIFKNGSMSKFNLGPLLPNMEKKYWIFIDCDMVKRSQEGVSEIFIALYFSYDYPGGTSAYGMISQYDKKNDSFVHKDMWLD